jgi:hypothetical protein
MMEVETVFETSDYNAFFMWLIAQDNFIAFSPCESFKSYKVKILFLLSQTNME